MQPRAAIFDLDGTLVDSARLHHVSWQQLCGELGLPPMTSEAFFACFGQANRDIIPDLLGRPLSAEEVERHSERKEAIYREVAVRELTLFPGARELLDGLHADGWQLAIGSSTPRANLAALVPALGLDGLLSATVGMEDVTRHKPAPDVFLECARRLGVAPARCLVFEDAPAGVQAAVAGGMAVVGVLTHHSRESLAGAVALVDGLWELTAADCAAWVGAA
ncbi:MAG: HAD family phosphatase [Armatimonadetes bacterium]|nr:HAD family phosphatase [Armatimonadota bacterium]